MLTKFHLFDQKYSKDSNIMIYYYNLKCNLLLWGQSWIFSISCNIIKVFTLIFVINWMKYWKRKSMNLLKK